MRNLNQIRQERAEVIDKARKIRDEIQSSEGSPDASRVEEFDSLMNRAEQLEAEAREAEALESRFSTLDDFNIEERSSDPLPHNDPNNKGKHEFSVIKALREAASGRLTGLEAETVNEIAKRQNEKLDSHQLILPMDLPVRTVAKRQTEEMSKSNSGGAIPTVVHPTLIEALRAKMKVFQLGATVFTDLYGDMAFPKVTAVSAAKWKDEGDDYDESEPRIGQVPMAPKRVGTYVEYTRKLFRQSSVDIEAFVRNDVATAVALAIDKAVINGSGQAPEPRGLLNNSDVSVVEIDDNGGSPTWGHIVELETQVDVLNALEGSLAYLTTPQVRGLLKQTERAEGTTGRFIWEELTNTINGYPAHTSTQVPSDLEKGTGEDLSAILFGDWSSVMVGFWGSPVITLNPYSRDTAAIIRVVIDQMADVNYRYSESFAVIKDAVTS